MPTLSVLRIRLAMQQLKYKDKKQRNIKHFQINFMQKSINNSEKTKNKK